jgi:hypothetical protein
MASMTQTFYVTDNYVNTTIFDDSIVIPTDPILPKKLQLLQPIFSGKGLANKILDFSSTSLVRATYGSDMDDIKKYGQGGLNLLHTMQGGASSQTCRLLPDDAEVATLLISVDVRKREEIPIYERLPNGKVKWTDGQKTVLDLGQGVEIRIDVTAGDAGSDSDKKPHSFRYTDPTMIPNPAHETWVNDKSAFETDYDIQNPAPVQNDEGYSGYPVEDEAYEAFEIRLAAHNSARDFAFAEWANENIEPSEEFEDPDNPRVLNGAVIPIAKFKYYGPGKCGNDFGVRIVNDYDRDDATNDGRRYALEFYTKDILGNDVAYGQTAFFSFNPVAEIVPGTGTYENLETGYANFDDNDNAKELQLSPFIIDNYETLMEILGYYINGLDAAGEPFDPFGDDPDATVTDPKELDFINCTDKSGREYNKFYKYEGLDGENEVIDFNDSIVHLMGGSDGSLQLGWGFKNSAGNPISKTYTPIGASNPVVINAVDESYIEFMKDALLIKFFNGQIDPAIFDERMVDSDILFDANYSFATVKQTMLGKFREIRPDIFVVADLGFLAGVPQAILMTKTIYTYVNGPTAWSAAVVIQAGVTKDRAVPIRVTATYDYGYGLARCYGSYGTFSVFAGYQAAKVTTMKFDWLPYKDEYDTMIGPLLKLGCIFAFKLDKQGTVAYMAEDSMYVEKYSKLKSMRNGMVIGDAVRLAKKVLIKYVYDNDGAAGAIRKATAELNATILGRYPSNIGVQPSLYRTERDTLLETSSCDINYLFPGMTKAWSLNIHARRAAA